MPENDFDWSSNYNAFGGGWGGAPAPAPAPAAAMGGTFGAYQMPAQAQAPAPAPYYSPNPSSVSSIQQSQSPFSGMDWSADKGSYGQANPQGMGETASWFMNSMVPNVGQTPAGDMSAIGSALGGFFGSWGGGQAAGGASTGGGSTQPMQYGTAAGGGSAPSSAGYDPATDYYSMGARGTYGATYKQPDWMRTAGAGFMQDRDATNAFFAANPQYAADWKNITSGGNSAFSTDGTSLIKSDRSSMSPEAAAYYAQNPHELLAAEGFGMDPTLQYMNYFQGPGSIGVNRQTQSVTDFLMKNKWTPNGIVANNNSASLAKTPFGAGAASFGFGGSAPATSGGAGSGSAGGAGGGSAGSGSGSYMGSPASNGGGSMSSTTTSGQNPYSQTLADMLANTMTNNWQRRIAPQIASNAAAVGGYGGSRQGVAEANSANDLNLGIGNALANLMSNNYNSSLNYDLGMAGNALGYANLDRAINNDNLSWQMQGANLGMTVQDRLLALSQLGLTNGTNIQNTPLNYWQQILNSVNGVGQGYGSTTQSGGGGNPLLGALGGAQLGSQAANWWNSQGNWNSMPNSNVFMGNGSMGD